MNNNIPIARWLSMFWLCSAVSLVLGQFSGSVTLNGTNGAALSVYSAPSCSFIRFTGSAACPSACSVRSQPLCSAWRQPLSACWP